MGGRVYHIGLPKTGTTSIQHLVQDFEWYCGVKQPRMEGAQSKVYEGLTDYLRGIQPEPPTHLPDVFFYSEEMILVNNEQGVAESNVRRLLSILRPQDKVVVTVRELRSLRVSAFYEFYRVFHGLPIEEVSRHPLMKPFTLDFFEALIPTDSMSQFVFSRLEDRHAKLGEVLGYDLPDQLLKSRTQNQRMKKGAMVVVKQSKKVFPKQLFWMDAILNPVMWRVNKKFPQNFFRSTMRSFNVAISPLTENQIAVLMDGVKSFK